MLLETYVDGVSLSDLHQRIEAAGVINDLMAWLIAEHGDGEDGACTVLKLFGVLWVEDLTDDIGDIVVVGRQPRTYLCPCGTTLKACSYAFVPTHITMSEFALGTT